MTSSAKNRKSLLLTALACVLLLSSATTRKSTRARPAFNKLPPVILWAWERPEDLKFLDPQRFGVAFLAQTLVLQNDEVVFRPRRQPLLVSPQTQLVAVTRIESQKTTGKRAALSSAQKDRIIALVLNTLALQNVSAIQIDFDAAASERPFYRGLLKDLRRQLPQEVSLTMTALASFCLNDRWLQDLPVDEAVPMIFRMGADDKAIKNSLAAGNDFREPLCRHSYGLAIDEPLDMQFESSRRLYLFANHAWSEKDIASLDRGLQK
jgi:hypothetical protein